MVIFPYVSVVVIGGFGVSRLMSGEITIAIFDFAVAAAFLALGTYTFLTGRETAARYMSAIVSLVGTSYFLQQGNPSGIFWVYSSSVVFYYLIPLRWAIGFNIVMLLFVGYIYQSAVHDTMLFYSFVGTIGLVNAFSMSFSELTRRSIQDRIELEQTQKEIKQLRELLPICASCHKIRDEEGNWHQMESYLSENRGTRFSHGVCPDCIGEYSV